MRELLRFIYNETTDFTKNLGLAYARWRPATNDEKMKMCNGDKVDINVLLRVVGELKQLIRDFGIDQPVSNFLG